MKLDRYTILHRKDERGVIVESGVFGPDDEVPNGFEKAEYEPLGFSPREPVEIAPSKLTPWESPVSLSWVQEKEPEEAIEVVEQAAEESEPETGDEGGDEPPPRGGAGSGVEEWRSYAESKGVEVDEDASRDDIVAAVKKAGHPV